MSAIDDLDFFYMPEEISDNWKHGFHIDQDGKEWELSGMTTKHLENTINYFCDSYDTKPLEDELKRRSK